MSGLLEFMGQFGAEIAASSTWRAFGKNNFWGVLVNGSLGSNLPVQG